MDVLSEQRLGFKSLWRTCFGVWNTARIELWHILKFGWVLMFTLLVGGRVFSSTPGGLHRHFGVRSWGFGIPRVMSVSLSTSSVRTYDCYLFPGEEKRD